MDDIFEKIKNERLRQDRKFGEQNHSPENWLAVLVEEVGEVSKEICEMRYSKESTDESYKSMLHFHEDNYITELIQCAAVCVAMVESFKRKK